MLVKVVYWTIRKYKDFRGFVKRNKYVFSLYRHVTDKDYREMKNLMKKCNVKTEKQIREEMRCYQTYWQCPPDDYIRYGLFGKELDIEDILDYVPMWHYYCVYCDDAFRGLDTYKWDDKWNQYQLLNERKILTPQVIAIVSDGIFINVLNNSSMALGDFSDNICGDGKIFIKPTDGNSGDGIIVIKKKDNKFFYKDFEIKNLSEIPVKKHNKYIVQKELLQRKDIREINPSSLNTFRVQTIYNNGVPTILTVILRLGRLGSDVDNSGQGGLSVDINLETGEFAECAGRVHGGGTFYEHPDSKFVFKGKKIEGWNDIMASIKEICNRVNDFKIVGWDFAIGDDNKVYVIEFNLGFGIEGTQITRGGLRRRMGIYPHKKS